MYKILLGMALTLLVGFLSMALLPPLVSTAVFVGFIALNVLLALLARRLRKETPEYIAQFRGFPFPLLWCSIRGHRWIAFGYLRRVLRCARCGSSVTSISGSFEEN